MKRLVLLIVVLSIGMSGTMQAQSKREKAREARKAREEQRKEERKQKEALEDAISYTDALQAINSQSFVVEANTLQPRSGRMFFVNPTTNFLAVSNGQATVQIASNSAINPGPNGLGGITVQGSTSDVKIKKDSKGNVFLSMSVQGVIISATVTVQLAADSNNAVVTVDPNFSGNILTLTGSLIPSSMSNIFMGSTI